MKFLSAATLLIAAIPAHAAVLVENFDNVSALTGAGWTVVNNSTPPSSTTWFQGNDTIFQSQDGAANSYAAANYLAGSSPGAISLWLISPVLTFAAGDIISFYTRTESPVVFADGLELRLSTNGASANVGATTTSVGDFSTLLVAVNPTFTTTNGYPVDWTFFSAAVNFTGSGRFAFRYVVDDLSVNGNYIGIDTLAVGLADVPEPASLVLTTLALAGLVARRRQH